jgi:hypothetical protein
MALGAHEAQTAGCGFPHRDAVLPPPERAFVAVLSAEIPGTIEQVARHAWILARVPGDRQFRKWELVGGAARSDTGAPYHFFGGGDGDVAVHGVIEGTPAEIERISACLDTEAERYDDRHPTYLPIPGPNSNTFVAEALRHCSIHVELPATAVGRDYRGPLGAGVTESGTGVQLESLLVGARIGLREGVEAHITGLALGVHAWPPGITVPVNPGRIGVDLDGHATPEQLGVRDGNPFGPPPAGGAGKREFGVAFAQLFARVSRVKSPELAGGLSERATVGLTGRAVRTSGHLGYGFGADFDLGMGFPGSFAYAIHVYPAGIAWTIGSTGYVGVFGGIGGSGVTARVPGAFELPLEARAEIDAGPVRFGLRAQISWIPWTSERRGGSVLPFGDELVLGSFVRIGRTQHTWSGSMGRGHFFGLERHEVMGTYWIGLGFGVEIDFGG